MSCRVLEPFFRSVPAGHAAAELCLGTGRTVAELTDKNRRVSWETFQVFLGNTATVFTPEQMEEIGRKLVLTPALRPFFLVARVLFDASGLYRWVFDRKSGAGNQLVGGLSPHFRQVSPTEVRIGFLPLPGRHLSRQFLLVCKGSLETMTRVLGLPPAEVQLLPEGQGEDFRILLPQRAGWTARARMTLARVFSIRAVAGELRDANLTLTAQNRELDQAKAVLAVQAEQLRTVALLGRELSVQRSMRELGDTLAGILIERFHYDGLVLWTAPQAGAELQVARVVGVREGQPVQTYPIKLGERMLGRIDVWMKTANADDVSLTESLVPWISVALQNAQSFELQQAYQEQLEVEVQIRTAELSATAAELERSLQQQRMADEQKSAFFANASHELRTPLTLMLGPIEALLEHDGLTAHAQAELKSVLRGGYRLLKLVNDVLDLSKIEAGRMTLRFDPTDLSVLLRGVLAPWAPVLARRRMSLEIDLPEVLPVTLDAERIEQVALNLISNAVKHTPEGGALRVAGQRVDANHVRFRVENTGPGIPPEELPHLFERFAQSPNARSRRFGTTGLGLPVVRELVELHGGDVSVENVPGEQVAFIVTLPRAPEMQPDSLVQPNTHAGKAESVQYQVDAEVDHVPAALAPKPSSEDQLDLPLLLIVEDNPELRAFLVRSLSAEFRILEADNGRTALELALAKGPDIVLSDLMMPELDGVQLVRSLRAEPGTQGIPFILLTARGELETKLLGMRDGANDYIVKPFHMEEVRTRLRAHLRLRFLTQELAQAEKLAALGTVVAGVAHEIRNPLNGIINSLLPLREMMPSETDPELRELLDIAVEGARRVESISAQLLRQARAGEGVRSEFDLSDNVALALQLLAHKSHSGPKVISRLSKDFSIKVVGEPGALNQVWVNLVDNAIHAAGRGGEVNVSVLPSEGQVSVEVRDNGPGMDARTAKRIFDPFFTTKPVGTGTGLGLSLVHKIVEQHGGTISVQSNVGQGATFRVTLPMSNAPTAGRGLAHAQG